MTFDAIEEGSAVFIDANVFIYHFAGASPQCTALLSRAANPANCGALPRRWFSPRSVIV